MLRFRYMAVEEYLFHPELGTCLACGIRVGHFQGGRWRTVALHFYVDCDGKVSGALAQACALFQLEPCHLADVAANATACPRAWRREAACISAAFELRRKNRGNGRLAPGKTGWGMEAGI